MAPQCMYSIIFLFCVLASFSHSPFSLSLIVSFPQAGSFFVKWSVWHELLPYACRLAKKIFRAALFLGQVFGHLLKSLTSSIQGLHQAWTVKSNGFLRLPNQARHCCADLVHWQVHTYILLCSTVSLMVCTKRHSCSAVFVWLKLQLNHTWQFLLIFFFSVSL